MSNKMHKWYVLARFAHGDKEYGYIYSEHEKSCDVIKELLGDPCCSMFTMYSQNGNAMVLINLSNMASLGLYTNEYYKD